MANLPVQGPIVVVGSINMDLVCRAPQLPAAGETIFGTEFLMTPGGKGANQSVAASRLSAKGQAVSHVGRVGADDIGQRLLNQLQRHGVDCEFVTVSEGQSSGIAMIIVEGDGENRIIVAPGANSDLSPADVERAGDLLKSASVVVMQLEIPLPTVRRVVDICKSAGVFTILDPAPVPPKKLPGWVFGVDLLTPNEREAHQILGFAPPDTKVKRKRTMDPKQIAVDLSARGAKRTVLKIGPRGAVSVEENGQIELHRGFRVPVVDTTAAGDAFTAALAVGRSEGMPLGESVRFANAAGALCCTKFGAQPALPMREDVDRLLDKM
jgi:ribokinase